MGQLAQERLDRPQYMPALFQRKRNNATFIFTLSFCEKKKPGTKSNMNNTSHLPGKGHPSRTASSTGVQASVFTSEFKRACSQVFPSCGYLAGRKQFNF